MHMPLGGSEQILRQLLTPLTAPAHLSFFASHLKFRILSGGINSSRYLYFQQQRLSRPAPISDFRYRELAWGKTSPMPSGNPPGEERGCCRDQQPPVTRLMCAVSASLPCLMPLQLRDDSWLQTAISYSRISFPLHAQDLPCLVHPRARLGQHMLARRLGQLV